MITFQDHGVECFLVFLDKYDIGLISRYTGVYKMVFHLNGVGLVLTAEDLGHISDKIKDLNDG